MATPATLTEIFFGAEARYAGRPAVMRRKIDGTWQDVSFTWLLDTVHHLVAAFHDLDFHPGDRIAILSENRPEWAAIDYACLAARLVDVPIYPTLTAQQTAYILRDAGARAIFVSSVHHLEKILSVRAALPDLQQVILLDGPPPSVDIPTFAGLVARGGAAVDRVPDWRVSAHTVQPDDLATLIYTSGTTGDPKGVMLSHGNITSNVVASLAVLPMSSADSCLSFLPLCHIFERMVGHYTMLQAGAVINYATSIESTAQELTEVHPTVLASVPRIYEKIHAAVLAKAARSALSLRIFQWAGKVGERRLQHRLERRPVPFTTAIAYAIADRLVFAKLRERMGGAIRFFVSGGAPLSPEICRFFLAAGMTLFEGYGLTETSPVIAANTFDGLKPGTVGRTLPGVRVRFADDGEILVHGPNVMLGYYRNPAATAEAIDRDGWFRTGDIGELDAEGFLRITDRKKDLIKTSGGKYVAPQPIEGRVRNNRFFANAVMLGDRRKFPIMLLVPDFGVLNEWMASQRMSPGEPEQVISNPQVRAKLEDEVTRTLNDLAPFETPKRFLILPRDFSIESGELTPSLKVKRRAVEQRLQQQIEDLYTES